ncbi:MAG: RNA 2',3'-cyclic phosphodiesterase [bacterium]
MKRRLFLGISLSKEVVEKVEIQADLLKQRFIESVRFVPSKNWHMTLIFLGDQEEEDIQKIRDSVDSVVLDSNNNIVFDDITYGPSEHKPRMIWLNATKTTSEYLDSLRKQIAKELKTRGIFWDDDGRAFHGHITLARFNAESDEINMPLLVRGSTACKDYTVELFSVTLKPDGSEYKSLHSVSVE